MLRWPFCFSKSTFFIHFWKIHHVSKVIATKRIARRHNAGMGPGGLQPLIDALVKGGYPFNQITSGGTTHPSLVMIPIYGGLQGCKRFIWFQRGDFRAAKTSSRKISYEESCENYLAFLKDLYASSHFCYQHFQKIYPMKILQENYEGLFFYCFF